MRVGFLNMNSYKNCFKSEGNGETKQKFFSIQEELFLKDTDITKNTKNKLQVARENGYIRHYILKSDGKKILISEQKDNTSDKQEVNKLKVSNYLDQHKRISTTKELIELVNQSVGANVPVQISLKPKNEHTSF